jgi:putative transposase
MINPAAKLAMSGQARCLGISRGTVYYLPAPTTQADLAVMKAMTKLHLAHPFMGQRQLLAQLLRQDVVAGRLHVRTLMQRMGLRAMCPQPGSNTSAPQPGQHIYP